MADKHIVVLDYGMGNIHSIVKALRLYSSQVEFTSNPSSIDDCDALVLPGDGAFQAGMENLAGPKEEHLRRFLDSGRPMLGICIGFQLLFHDSSEVHNPDGSMGEGLVPGLKLIPGLIRRFSGDDVRVPHMGWNTLKGCSPDSGLTDGDWMYFIHSYHAAEVPAENVLAYSEYGGVRFPAAVSKDNIIATQFHPEKSDRTGLAFLERWVQS
ncbi:MAG TPA: imidazole glycerol phosphate synthase subunit HisH [Leptospiraceae bacterium]|nr:imidazole glycerol phosphate synthase subunit HisH [Spirochaetaceae bacterium]HBS06148.1 imidazole glycerol phosphate synthase subunit HisH [Leptospiraceae bacterium]|tara:strand:- start:64183 stop:64815 length:633 start_codon:yes stop_codon:yes gene_type:complete